jgi:hypothetical protein
MSGDDETTLCSAVNDCPPLKSQKAKQRSFLPAVKAFPLLSLNLFPILDRESAEYRIEIAL